jgi:phosphoribosylamine--glycine ligase
MNILIIGSGGREYSIALALKKENKNFNLYFMPGNGATTKLGENITTLSYDKLAIWAKQKEINLTIVGPEQPLVDGICDIFRANNLTIFGPNKFPAKLEGSKAYMKNILKKYNIPTASFVESADISVLNNFIDNMPNLPIVVKADGLCGGKGVIIATSKQQAKNEAASMLSGENFGTAGNRVIVEEFLDGFELSVFAVCDEDSFIVLPAAQDHKRVGDGDTGPNTGGMGAYCPTPLITDDIYQKIETNIIKPTLDGMKKENATYTGVLFVGVMVVSGEPIVLEYNVRFGDPECETILPLFNSSVFDMFYKTATNNLSNYKLQIQDRYCVSVVMCSKSYPYKTDKPTQIIIDDICDDSIRQNSYISYAGVSKTDGELFAHGGRVLLCIGMGSSIAQARDIAYKLCGQVHFAGKKIRTDIAYQAI